MADEPNEILAAVANAKARKHGAASSGDAAKKKNRWPMGIIGVGIGSAAIAAAVLFARSGTKD